MLLNAPPTISVRRALLCRACGSASLRTFFSLGAQPFANAFLNDPDEQEFRVPLALQRCNQCTLIQLTHVVDPDVLYGGYKFASGVSAGWQQHCADLLDGRRPGRLLDIASNDGTLVRLAEAMGWEALGVDPAPIGDYPVIQGFWPAALGQIRDQYDLIVAQNVFGHVDTVLDFLRACEATLAPGGRLVIECPDTLRTLEEIQYDQVYHEHLSYWTLLPLWTLAIRAKLDIVHVEPLAIHGGSLRYWLAKSADPEVPSSAVTRRLTLEQALRKPALTRRFAVAANTALTRCTNELRNAVGQCVKACGASAKSTVVLNALADRGAPMPTDLLDDAPLKQGLYSPGTHVPVVPFHDLSRTDVILLTAWNWATVMKEKCVAHGFRGRFILPHG